MKVILEVSGVQTGHVNIYIGYLKVTDFTLKLKIQAATLWLKTNYLEYINKKGDWQIILVCQSKMDNELMDTGKNIFDTVRNLEDKLTEWEK